MFTKLLLEYLWWDQHNLFSQLKIGDFLSQFSKHWHEELFRILATHKLAQEQKSDKVGGWRVSDGTIAYKPLDFEKLVHLRTRLLIGVAESS